MGSSLPSKIARLPFCSAHFPAAWKRENYPSSPNPTESPSSPLDCSSCCTSVPILHTTLPHSCPSHGSHCSLASLSGGLGAPANSPRWSRPSPRRSRCAVPAAEACAPLRKGKSRAWQSTPGKGPPNYGWDAWANLDQYGSNTSQCLESPWAHTTIWNPDSLADWCPETQWKKKNKKIRPTFLRWDLEKTWKQHVKAPQREVRRGSWALCHRTSSPTYPGSVANEDAKANSKHRRATAQGRQSNTPTWHSPSRNCTMSAAYTA